MIIILGPWILFCKWFSVLSITLANKRPSSTSMTQWKLNRRWMCAATCCPLESLTKWRHPVEKVKHCTVHRDTQNGLKNKNSTSSPLTGLKKLKKESCGTSLVTVLTVPLPLCFCFFLIVFTVISLPFSQSILQLDTQNLKKKKTHVALSVFSL